MSMLRIAMIFGAGALGAAVGYAQGKMDAIKDKMEYHRLSKDSPEYTLKDNVNNLVKKTAEVMNNAKDQIINSKEFEKFGKSFTRDELMHLLCNSQVFDTVVDILKQNNGEFRPGYYFKKDEWAKYSDDIDQNLRPKMNEQMQCQSSMSPNASPSNCSQAVNMPYHKPEVYSYPPTVNFNPYRCTSEPFPISKKSLEEYQENGETPPINTIISRFRSAEEQPKKPSDAPRVEETDGSKTIIKKK